MGLFNFSSKSKENPLSNETEGFLGIILICVANNNKITVKEIDDTLLHPLFNKFDREYLFSIMLEKYNKIKDQDKFLSYANEVITDKNKRVIIKLVFNLILPHQHETAVENKKILDSILTAFKLSPEDLVKIASE